ncbi:CDP-alcohol phosphatidyltransferase family protein [Actinoplanes sp. NPDC051633]|uniref:CDP-alcohol phosphatidyltransferase family protein n=1 Tax=Actinoplanes sp. NPDC051633 TaxID=3155670 RepID=UPI0034401902
MNWPDYAAAWSALHGGFDVHRASPLVRGWVRIAWRAGGLLGRLGIGPTTVTLIGLLLCLLVPVAASWKFWGLIVAALLVLAASFADSFDGAVAVVTGRAGKAGFVVDSVADRLGEAAWLVALWVGGAPAWLAVAAGGVSWLHEYVRARATAAGMADIGAVTLGERPTRVSAAISGLLIGGVAGLVHAEWAATVLTVATAAWLALSVVGVGPRRG